MRRSGIAAIALLWACSREPAPVQTIAHDTSPSPTATVSTPLVIPAGRPLHHVVDPDVLGVLDRDVAAPLSFAAVIARLHRDADLAPPERAMPTRGPTRTSDLHAHGASWRVVTTTLAGDIERLVAEIGLDWEDRIDRTYDPAAAKTEIGRHRDHRGNGNVMRVFTPRWLDSPDGIVSLAGVVYRPDRRDFVPGTCGELRLVYRLGYATGRAAQARASRLPFTINAVFAVPDPGDHCQAVAARWRSEAAPDAARVLAMIGLDTLRFMQLETNVQLARFPSDLERVDGRNFAGQAVYGLRIFAARDGRLAPITLENTPDVAAIARDPDKRARLRAFVAEHLAEIDVGVFRLPDDLLAEIALSWSTLGGTRPANRPFAALLTAEELDGIVAGTRGERRFVVDGASLLERLDAATCTGCHQSAATAGFHLLGLDRRQVALDDPDAAWQASDGNRLQLGYSPHFAAEIPRRTAYLDALAHARAPDRFRPHPSAPPADWTSAPVHAAAGVDAACPLAADTLAAGAMWSCDPALHCRDLVGNATTRDGFGNCMHAETDVRAGDSCRSAEIAAAPLLGGEGLAWNVGAFADRVVDERRVFALPEDGRITANAYNCRPSRIGVPLGRVTRHCRASEWSFAGLDRSDPVEICAIVGGKGFERMATGVFDPARFAASVGRGLLHACSPDRGCREDYICQRLPDFLAAQAGVDAEALAEVQRAGIGFCTPTYFVYQLRLDGHPDPSG